MINKTFILFIILFVIFTIDKGYKRDGGQVCMNLSCYYVYLKSVHYDIDIDRNVLTYIYDASNYLFYALHYLHHSGVDLDCQIKRPKVPKTALPSDVRSRLGLQQRNRSHRKEIILSQSSKVNYDGSCRISNNRSNHSSSAKNTCLMKRGMTQIKKQPFLKKGSGLPGNRPKKCTISITRQTIS